MDDLDTDFPSQSMQIVAWQSGGSARTDVYAYARAVSIAPFS
jgi:hypothetical protein